MGPIHLNTTRLPEQNGTKNEKIAWEKFFLVYLQYVHFKIEKWCWWKMRKGT